MSSITQPRPGQKVIVAHNGEHVSAEVMSASSGGFCYRTRGGVSGFCASGVGTWTPDYSGSFGDSDIFNVFSSMFGAGEK